MERRNCNLNSNDRIIIQLWLIKLIGMKNVMQHRRWEPAFLDESINVGGCGSLGVGFPVGYNGAVRPV